ncbi:MAG: histone [Candidatus Altiarchaeota archaeon]|nr:histone [Candidatus Altiarchaeota archaeon]
MAEVFAIAPFKKLLRGTGNRVGNDAAEALGEVTEEIGYLIIEEALVVASENKRKTVRKEDIIEAKRRLW